MIPASRVHPESSCFVGTRRELGWLLGQESGTQGNYMSINSLWSLYQRIPHNFATTIRMPDFLTVLTGD